jgi:hypothetical protein
LLCFLLSPARQTKGRIVKVVFHLFSEHQGKGSNDHGQNAIPSTDIFWGIEKEMRAENGETFPKDLEEDQNHHFDRGEGSDPDDGFYETLG